MTLVKQNPKVLNKLFDDLIYNFPYTWGRDVQQNNNVNVPSVKIHEATDGYHVELSAPGRSKEKFAISVEAGLLNISYENNDQAENIDFKTVRREFSYKNFKRSFSLDEKVNADAIQARYENGILQIFIPKKEEVKNVPKQITIL